MLQVGGVFFAVIAGLADPVAVGRFGAGAGMARGLNEGFKQDGVVSATRLPEVVALI